VLLSLWQALTRLFWQISSCFFWQVVAQSVLYKVSHDRFVRKMSTNRVIGGKYLSCTGRLPFVLLSLWQPLTRLFWQVLSWLFWQIVAQSVLYKLSHDRFYKKHQLTELLDNIFWLALDGSDLCQCHFDSP